MNRLFAFSGLAKAPFPQVLQAIDALVKEQGFVAHPARETDDEDRLLVLAATQQCKITIRYPQGIALGEPSVVLSERLPAVPVLALNIFEEQFWFYALYLNGREIGQYLPVPLEYFGIRPEQPQFNRRREAESLAAVWPGAKAEEIARYLVPWTEAEREPACPGDRYGAGDDLQCFDFMRRLGLPPTRHTCFPATRIKGLVEQAFLLLPAK